MKRFYVKIINCSIRLINAETATSNTNKKSLFVIKLSYIAAKLNVSWPELLFL